LARVTIAICTIKRAFISKQSYFITEVDDEFLTLSRHTLKVADLNNLLSEL